MPGPTTDTFPAIPGSGSWARPTTTRSSAVAHGVLCALARAALQGMEVGTTTQAKPPKPPSRAAQRTMLFACLDILALILALWRWS